MPVFDSHAGFNITEDKLQIVELNYSNKFLLENVDEEFFSEPLDVNFQESKFINILQNSFDQLLIRKPINTNLVSFSLPNQFFKIFEIPYDKTLVKSDLSEHFKWEMSVLFPQHNPDDFVIRSIEIEKTGFRKENNVIIIAALKSILHYVHKFCLRNNLKLRFVDNAHFAANSFVTIENPNSKNDFFISIYFSQKEISIIAASDNYPFYFKKITQDKNSDFVDTILNLYDSLNNIGVDTSRALKNYITGTNVTQIMIQRAKDELDINFIKFSPFTNFAVSDDFDIVYFGDLDHNTFSAAAGIALRMI